MLHECPVTMPGEDFVTSATTRGSLYGQAAALNPPLAHEIAAYLEPGVKLIVVACNAATSALPRSGASWRRSSG